MSAISSSVNSLIWAPVGGAQMQLSADIATDSHIFKYTTLCETRVKKGLKICASLTLVQSGIKGLTHYSSRKRTQLGESKKQPSGA